MRDYVCMRAHTHMYESYVQKVKAVILGVLVRNESVEMTRPPGRL